MATPEQIEAAVKAYAESPHEDDATWGAAIDAATTPLLEAANRLRDCAESYAEAQHDPMCSRDLRQQMYHDVVMAIADYDVMRGWPAKLKPFMEQEDGN